MKSILVNLQVAFFSLLPIYSAYAGNIGFTQRVDVSSKGVQSDRPTQGIYQRFVSVDGRYVVFSSDSTTLVPGDTNSVRDVFLYDVLTGKIERVNVDSSGNPPTTAPNCSNYYSGSLDPTISADGRYVAFSSSATTLVANDTNCMPDVFVRDRKLGKTYLISVAASGGGTNDWSGVASLSADGRYVAYWSQANNIFANDTNTFQDAFVYDRQTGKTKLVSVSSAGAQGNNHSGTPTISADGRYVAFGSLASNLISFDINNVGDIFLRDLKTGKTTLVSANPSSFTGNNLSYRGNDSGEWVNFRPDISADGRYVAFSSYASDLVGGDTNNQREVFVRDTKTNKTSRAAFDSYGQQATSDSTRPAISPDGRMICFVSNASNLDPWNYNGNYQVFSRDLLAGITTLVSQSTDGDLGNQQSWWASSISADGRYIAFESSANNLVPWDTNDNNSPDIFLRDRLLDPIHQADVSLSQSASANPVTKGQKFSYTITLNNAGVDSATNAALIDIPPSLGSLVSVAPSQGSCSLAAIIVCRLGTVKAKAQAKVVITLNASSAGQYLNQAWANAVPVDLVRTNNASSLTVQVKP
jgi:uncharacterized repeat protein (TIGR01451 family)